MVMQLTWISSCSFSTSLSMENHKSINPQNPKSRKIQMRQQSWLKGSPWEEYVEICTRWIPSHLDGSSHGSQPESKQSHGLTDEERKLKKHLMRITIFAVISEARWHWTLARRDYFWFHCISWHNYSKKMNLCFTAQKHFLTLKAYF